MTHLKAEIPIFLFAAIFFICFSLGHCRPKGGLTLDLLRSDEAGRLRRGFQSASLATARGFGKRSSSGAIPFVNVVPEEGMSQDPYSPGRSFSYDGPTINRFPNRDKSYPIAVVIDMVRTNQALARAIVEHYVDLDGDGLISLEELERLQ